MIKSPNVEAVSASCQGALDGAFDGCDTVIHLAADGRQLGAVVKGQLPMPPLKDP